MYFIENIEESFKNIGRIEGEYDSNINELEIYEPDECLPLITSQTDPDHELNKEVQE